MSSPIDIVRSELVGIELEAVSLLLHHWAKPEVVSKREQEWKDKIPALRSAVAAKIKSGKMHTVEDEFVYNESLWIEKAIEWAQSEINPDLSLSDAEKWLRAEKVPFRVKVNHNFIEIHRPFPISELQLEEVTMAVHGNDKSQAIVNRAVADRLGISEKKVRNTLAGKRDKRVDLSEGQSLLVSLFLDVCSKCDDSIDYRKLQTKILNTLYGSGCHIIFVFYLIRTAHRFKSKIYLGQHDFEMVSDLCEAVCQMPIKVEYQPFIRLISQK